jgi:hypothetical protein
MLQQKQIDNLWTALNDAEILNPSSIQDWHKLPKVGELPDPSITWMLINAFRYHRRFRKVKKLLRTNKRQILESLAEAERCQVNQESSTASCSLPGRPNISVSISTGSPRVWRFNNKNPDAQITINLAKKDPVDFIADVRETSLPCETRLQELHKPYETLEFSAGDLQKLGLLSGFAVTPKILAHKKLIKKFCVYWNKPGWRFSMAAWIGDWSAVQQHLPETKTSPEVRQLVAQRCSAVRNLRSKELRQIFDHADGSKASGHALSALAEMKAKEFPAYLRKALRGPLSDDTLRAIVMLLQVGQPARYYDDVMKLFRRLDQDKEGVLGASWCLAIHFLLDHGPATPYLQNALLSPPWHCFYLVAQTALQYIPRLLPKFLAQPLYSGEKKLRSDAAAVLGLIDEPWSRRLLQKALRTTKSRTTKIFCLVALSKSSSPAARRAASGLAILDRRKSKATLLRIKRSLAYWSDIVKDCYRASTSNRVGLGAQAKTLRSQRGKKVKVDSTSNDLSGRAPNLTSDGHAGLSEGRCEVSDRSQKPD